MRYPDVVATIRSYEVLQFPWDMERRGLFFWRMCNSRTNKIVLQVQGSNMNVHTMIWYTICATQHSTSALLAISREENRAAWRDLCKAPEAAVADAERRALCQSSALAAGSDRVLYVDTASSSTAT